MRKLLKKQGFTPEVLVTDKLRSYGAAKSELGLSARHEQGLRKNNRAENSHQPIRRREVKMQRFKSPGSAQHFLSVHAAVHNTFNTQRHLTSRDALRRFCRKPGIGVGERSAGLPSAYAARMSNCSAREGRGLKAYLAWCLRIMAIISMPLRIVRALSVDLKPSIGRTRLLMRR